MRNKMLIAMMMMALIVAACGGRPPSPAPTSPLAQPPSQRPRAAGRARRLRSSRPRPALRVGGTRRTLTTLNGQPALTDTTVTLNFEAGRVAVSDGCNRYNTTYAADGTNLLSTNRSRRR